MTQLQQSEAQAPVTVALASANVLLLRRLRGGVTATMDVVATADDAAGIVLVARRDRPDLLLLDGDLPGGAVEATRKLCDQALGTVVLITADAEPDERMLLSALRAGASGVLPAATTVGRLAPALHGVLRGEAALPRHHVRLLLEEFQARPGRSFTVNGRRIRLTQRELEVLSLLRLAHSTTSVAHRLGIAPTTVRTHVATLQRKARVSNRKDLLLVLGG